MCSCQNQSFRRFRFFPKQRALARRAAIGRSCWLRSNGRRVASCRTAYAASCSAHAGRSADRPDPDVRTAVNCACGPHQVIEQSQTDVLTLEYFRVELRNQDFQRDEINDFLEIRAMISGYDFYAPQKS